MAMIAGRSSIVRTPSGALADMFKALSDPIRITILGFLRKGELCERDFADRMEMLPQDLLSQHLAVLHEQGLIKARRDNASGRWLYYSIDAEAVAELNRQCNRLFDTSAICDAKESRHEEGNFLSVMAEAVA